MATTLFQQPYDSKFKSGDIGIQYISERHVACVFLLDTSGSMNNNDAIGKLNNGLQTFKSQILSDTKYDKHTKSCIDVALISFGPGVVLQQDFVPVSNMATPTLKADGLTPMGEALELAMNLITQQKTRYNELSTPYFRPWIFCITDGEPTDEYSFAAARLRKMEEDTKILGYCVGVENFNRSIMANIFNKDRIFELLALDFTSLFTFVSSSIASARNADEIHGGKMDVPSPTNLKKMTIEF
jgi:uncharacterized protein YegL